MITQTVGKIFWMVALVAALVFCGFAYYLKYPDIRPMVDEKAPFVKQIAGSLIARWDSAHAPEQAPDGTAPAAKTSPSPASLTDILTTATPAPAATAAAATPQPQPDQVDLQKLSQTRAEWPKFVSLKTKVDFPAVMDGKIVGTVQAPVGTQAVLLLIKDGKLALEYQGGGAMVPANQTDLIERVRASHPAIVP
jgi:hypothetical protein